MELKLQQAIVATRAGRTDVAQHLLTQLINDNPDDANAWFLMGHIVDEPDRQARYLQKAVELDPDHAIAKEQLMRLDDPPVPAPVVPTQALHESNLQSNGDESATNIAPVASVAAAATTTNELPEWLQDLDNKQLQANSTHDDDWQDLAGVPVRDTQKTSAPTKTPPIPQNQPEPKPESRSQSGEVWLVRILVIMVIVAAIVLGILVLLILI